MNKLTLVSALLFVLFIGCNKGLDKKEHVVKFKTDAKGNSYEFVTNDPTGLRIYTLDNGLKVYLSKNVEEPKIQTLIAVRTGSVYDPADNTGLAHYLEHMLFKGTSKIGANEWEKEKVALKEIENLYEKHKQEKDPEKKKDIYREIDKLSLEASKLCIANEYDKMISSLGAQGTNAFTSNEQTVYVNKIPSNEFDKWLSVESERFSELVLRLFHTELEAVYEEYNRTRDNDGWKKYETMLANLFPTHPYGQQSTIGTSEHLKNPSLKAINAYFDKYYVPNNMAVILSGDIQYEETFEKVKNAFGHYEKKELNKPILPKEKPITKPIIAEVYGPTAESVYLAYRLDGKGSEDEKLMKVCDMILNNSSAGLIDLNLNQKQLVQYASSFNNFNIDYGMQVFDGTPKSGQSLEEVVKLIQGEIDKLKKGEFEDWLIEAVVNDLKLNEIRRYENSSSVAYQHLSSYVLGEDWKNSLDLLDEMGKVTKQDVMNFANRVFQNNYVVVYKRQGEDKNIVRVENPGITPVELNRDKKSQFLSNFEKMESSTLKPQSIDFDEKIKSVELSNGLTMEYIENETNDLFSMYVLFEMGKKNDKELPLAINYLEYLGTNDKTAEEVKKEFYKLGITYGVSSSDDLSYIYMRGLRENFEEGIKLLDNLLTNAKADKDAYEKLVESILKERTDTTQSKDEILWNGLYSFGIYGENSPLRDIFSSEELNAMNPESLVQKVRNLKNYKQKLFYYGKEVYPVSKVIEDNYVIASELKEYPEIKKYDKPETGGNVYFVDYDMVQSELMFISKGETFDPKNIAAARLFNTYFGSGLSSIVFQEIRESKSLAYSAFSSYSTASEAGEPDYTLAYVGTQANKLDQAVQAMFELMNEMPEAQKQFEAAKESALKKIAAQRITKSNIYFTARREKKKGIDYDNREEVYKAIEAMTMEDLKSFFNKNIKGNDYNVVVVGKKQNLNMKALSKLGNVKELDVNYLFNYKNDDVKM